MEKATIFLILLFYKIDFSYFCSEIIPVINKIDLPNADPDAVR